ncbi:hypothetical protein [Streptomyces sp. NPDC001435]|uniref:hypothetical protein n=1 Tax=unclassified Streptomyces TaxID=2593676 RepID=UPI0036C53D25
MLLGLAYLRVANAFAMLRLLPVSDQGKDIEILALRHPNHGAGTPTRQGQGAVHPERSGVPGRVAAPAPA